MNTDTVARVLAALARNDGRLSVTLANEVGIDRQTLKRAADAGLLLHTGWGKYADPSLPPKQLALQGAHLGTDAILSHRGSGHVLGMDALHELVLEWSIPHEMKSTGALIHRRRRFGDLDVVRWGGILMTSPAQTLADLGACAAPTSSSARSSARPCCHKSHPSSGCRVGNAAKSPNQLHLGANCDSFGTWVLALYARSARWAWSL